MAGKVSHPDLVARIKGAAVLGVPKKVIARASGVSLTTVEAYVKGRRRADVEPNSTMDALLCAFMRGEI